MRALSGGHGGWNGGFDGLSPFKRSKSPPSNAHQEGLVQDVVRFAPLELRFQVVNPAAGHRNDRPILVAKAPQSAVAEEPHVRTDGDTRHVPIDRHDSQELGPELIVPNAHGRQSIIGGARPATAPPACPSTQ